MSKFLTFEDHLTIEKGLRENLSFGAIAKELGKDRTTVAKEVRKYAYDLKSGYSNYPYNACVHRVACKAKKGVRFSVYRRICWKIEWVKIKSGGWNLNLIIYQ